MHPVIAENRFGVGRILSEGAYHWPFVFLFSSSLLTVTGRYIAFVHIDIYLQAKIYGVLDSFNHLLLVRSKSNLVTRSVTINC